VLIIYIYQIAPLHVLNRCIPRPTEESTFSLHNSVASILQARAHYRTKTTVYNCQTGSRVCPLKHKLQ